MLYQGNRIFFGRKAAQAGMPNPMLATPDAVLAEFERCQADFQTYENQEIRSDEVKQMMVNALFRESIVKRIARDIGAEAVIRADFIKQ